MAQTLVGKGRSAALQILDPDSFQENIIGGEAVCDKIAPGAMIGTGKMDGREVTVISNDAMAPNPRFPVVYAGVIGLEEGYKMAMAVYKSIEADIDKPADEKRPLVLLIDTPGNGPGKLEEMFGMNKSTGAYQLALAEARQHGHPVVAMIIGRAISGAFLCHGLQADRILSLSADFGTMIHVMPLAGIARITKMDIEKLEELSKTNPVFASGAQYFHKLGGVEEVVDSIDAIKGTIMKHIDEVYELNRQGKQELLGPWGRGILGAERGGRTLRQEVIEKYDQEFAEIEEEFLSGD